jgi:hypothetical protein
MSTINLSKDFYINNIDTYPPFKNGLYLEEYFSNYITKLNPSLSRYYINAHWTNIQIHPTFQSHKNKLQQELNQLDPNKKYFTIVQYDDSILFNLPKDTLIFGSCSGDIPLPLIYEDNTNYLESFPRVSYNQKYIQCSFIGSLTHNVRHTIYDKFKDNQQFLFHTSKWTPNVQKSNADLFIEVTLNSKFVLAPRGYGRSSFRFFEVFQLGSIPIYVWDDIEWLPYKDILDYSKFCISLNVKEIDKLPKIISKIDENKYNEMLGEYQKVKDLFTLKGMSEYIINIL